MYYFSRFLWDYHMIILFLLFFIISEDTQMWLGQIFDFFQKSEMGGSIKEYTCKKHWSSHSKVFSLKTDTPCSRILGKWNKSANNMTIVSAQVSYLRKHLKIHICGWGKPLKCNQYYIASVWKLILEENCTMQPMIFATVQAIPVTRVSMGGR